MEMLIGVFVGWFLHIGVKKLEKKDRESKKK